MNPSSPSASPQSDDTIAALASGVGGAVAVIRVSGPDAVAVADQAWTGRQPLAELPPRVLHLGRIQDSCQDIDTQTMAVYMPGPRTFTGEDVVEFHCHGGTLGVRLTLMQILKSGARHAEPGEFTKRAFLNGKMDLTQAEAVNDLIQAHTEMALRLANRQLRGLLGSRVNAIYAELAGLLAEIESRMDFPEEHLDWMPVEKLVAQIEAAAGQIGRLLDSRQEGQVLREGVRLVLAGPPNAGKSSLLNCILGRDRAIVTAIPGTTRDTLEELAHIRGIPVRLIDTAGIREAEDLVERTGIQRSFSSIEEAQIVLWVYDAGQPRDPQACPALPGRAAVIPVANKLDTLPEAAPRDPNSFYTCAISGAGLDRLFDEVERLVWQHPHPQEPDVAVSARHAALLDQAAEELAAVLQELPVEAWELAAVSLRGALDAIGRISGRTHAPDVLDTIFANFCIGK